MNPCTRRLAFLATLTAGAVLATPAIAPAADGTWQRTWGKDVIQTGSPGDTGTGFEICVVASSCKVGDNTGALGGELDFPFFAATDAAGNVYVTETGNDRVQKFDSQGNFLRAWGKDVVAGGGTGAEVCILAALCKAGETTGDLGGEFDTPTGIAVDASGNVYVADRGNDRIQKFDSDGAFLRAWGKDVDQTGGTGFEICLAAASCKAGVSGGLGGEFNSVNQLAVDAAGNVYATDSNNNRVQKFGSDGSFLRTWGKDVDQTGGTGAEICVAAASCKAGVSGGLGGEFFAPIGVATDANDVYVSGSTGQHRIQRFDPQGNFERAWGENVVQAGKPEDTGAGFEICTIAADCLGGSFGGLGGEMRVPAGLATDSAGNVYVGDEQNDRIQQFTSQGAFVRAWGRDVVSGGGAGYEICTVAASCQPGATGGEGGALSSPFGLGSHASGTLYVTDFVQHRVQKFVDGPPPPPTPPSGGAGAAPPPSAAATPSANAAPDTTITEGPEVRTKKRRATFAFTGADARSIAGFQCKLDDGPFESCSSPATFSGLKKGEHTFQVRAVDDAGNIDPSPAIETWKVKKKKK